MKTSNVSSLIRHSNVSLSLRSCCVWSNLSLPCRSNLLSERSHIPSISTAVSKELSFAAKTMRCGVVSSAMAESTDTTESVDTEYEAVIGIECHVQLNTLTKAFCSCLNKFGMEPNSNICPVCLGHPGTLPVINEQVVRKGILAGLALNCSIALASKFDRKQYFYADLPKGYQISQYDEPLCYDGWIQVPLPENDSEKRIRIERAHLEEDAGKLVYSDRLSGSTFSLVDYNRAGVPLLEIVSGPDMRNGKEAAAYASELRRIMRFLNVSDGNMQEGSMRCDVNISVRKKEAETFGTKVEIKNMNSFNAMQRAIDFEFQRQVTLLKTGQGDKIIQETRLWNEDQQITESMRKKEGLADYRYFPEPDLPPLELKPEMIDELKQTMPELPASKRARYTSIGLSEYDAAVLSDELDVSIFYDAVIAAGAAPKLAANWVMGDIMAYCKEERLAMGDLPMQPKTLAEMIKLIENSTISGKIGKEILPALLDGEAEVDGVAKYIEDKGLIQISDVSALTEIVAKVLADNPKQLEQYRSGKTKLQGFFVGQAMKESKGRANPAELNKILMKKLNEA